MASSEAPPASRVTSSVNITIGAPGFYNTPKKFAPVVAPKPRVNPYKASGNPPSISNTSRAQLGRVGETPPPAEDLPPPAPHAAEDQPLPWPGDSLPPPPPPPPPFEDSFPPPPGDMTFPSPPPPLEEEGPRVEGPRETEAAELSPGIHSQIEALTSMLNEMEGNDPYKARVPLPEATTNGHPAIPPAAGAAASAQPWGVPGPRGRGFSPIRAPKPGPKPTFPGGRGRGELASGPAPGPGSGPRALAPSLPDPIPEISPSPGSQIVPREKVDRPATANSGERESGPGSRPEEGAALSYQDVQELESLATELLREMEKHPRGAGRPTELCAQCQKELSRSAAVVKAMQKLFHIECFVCSSCRRELQGQQFYEVDGQPLCEGCYQDTLEKCAVCQQPITEKMLRATGKAFHPQCFTCTDCRAALEGKPFITDSEGKVYCVGDYHRRFAPKCSVCNEPIIPEEGKEETVRILALGRNFHVKCYRCEDCSKQLSSEATEDGCYPLDDHVLCLQCHQSRLNKASRK